MPIFEYDCERCGKHFDVFVRSKKDRNPCCPECGCKKCRKAFSTFAMGGSSKSSSSDGGSSGGSSCGGCVRSSCAGCN